MDTRDVARFVTQVQYEDLPREVVDQAKLVVRDTLAVAVAAHDDRAVRAAAKFAVEYLSGPQQATILGTRIKVPCAAAALVNAVMASTLDMDDSSLVKKGDFVGPRGHPGCVVVPASLSVAEWQETNGKRFLEAVVTGYEIAIRSNAMMMLGGKYPGSGASGAYGATAAAAKLLGLDEMQTVQALGICESHCPRPPWDSFNNGIAMTKEVCGWGAMTGVAAALLAKAGFQGPPTMYDLPEKSRKHLPNLGAEGLTKALLTVGLEIPSTYDPLQNLGGEWGIMSACFKEYSACYVCHAAIDGVFELVAEHSLQAGDVAAVHVEGSSWMAMAMGRQRPTNIWDAQYSIPFAIGAAIVDGEVGPDQIAEERLSDPAILSIAERVQVVADEKIDRIPIFGRFAAKVTIETVRGQRFETFKAAPRGVLDELTNNDLEKKFTKLVTKPLGVGRTQSLNVLITTLENLQSVDDLVEGTTVEMARGGRSDSK